MPQLERGSKGEVLDRPPDTRTVLVDAAIAALVEDGYAATSARSIARRAAVNQALVFYHFGSVSNLLLAALDHVSAERMAAYGAALGDARSTAELIAVATTIFEHDLERGYVKVLAEMIAGSGGSAELGREVWNRVEPWLGFTEDTVGNVSGAGGFEGILPVADLAYGVVALYLGLELLTHLHGDRQPAVRLFEHAARLASLLAVSSASRGGAR